MNGDPPYDPRSVANHLLDLADSKRIETTHLKLQKLLFFAYGSFLSLYGKPLFKKGFEAWEYGPVNRLVYSQFRECGAEPIQTRALKTNIITDSQEICTQPLCAKSRACLEETTEFYGRIPTAHLVEMCHRADGAWHKVWHAKDGQVRLGLAINDHYILEEFSSYLYT